MGDHPQAILAGRNLPDRYEAKLSGPVRPKQTLTIASTACESPSCIALATIFQRAARA